MLSHGTIAITLDIYSYVSPGLKQQAVTKLEALRGGQYFLVVVRQASRMQARKTTNRVRD
jgi:hypothetical protein